MAKILSSSKILILTLSMFLCSGSCFARILGKYFNNDSVIWEIKEYSVEDESPYLEALHNKYNTLMERIEKTKKYENIAEAYLSTPNVSGINAGTSAIGLTVSIFSTIQADKRARKERDQIITDDQKTFVKMIIEDMRADNNPKDAEKVEKEMKKKGKLSNKARPYLRTYLSKSTASNSVLFDTIRMINTWITDGKAREGVKIMFPDKSFPTKYLTKVDTILNLNWRPFEFIKASSKEDIFSFSPIDEINPLKNIPDNWSWLDNNEDRESITQDYPIQVSYYKYASNPKYRVKQTDDWDKIFEVYDSNGTLICVRNGEQKSGDIGDSKFKKNIYAFAYKNNYYDIKKETSHAQHYVKHFAGLEKLTAKEQKEADRATSKLANYFLNSMTADLKYGSNSRKAKAVKEKSAISAVGTLLGGSSFYDSKGKSWLNQIERDFSTILQTPYKSERIDDTTFRNLYVDKDGNGIIEVITSYRQGKQPYSTVVNYEIRNLSKKFFSQEQLEEYISLIHKIEKD